MLKADAFAAQLAQAQKNGPEALYIITGDEPLLVIDGCRHWADDFTWSMLTLHTGHWLLINLGMAEVTREVGVDADPVHLATHPDLLFAYHRDVVFCLTSD